MTTDGFTRMIDDSNAFFAELSRNNTKEWFDPRKDHYNENVKKPAEFFADLMADDLSRIAGRAMKPKVFRIYRDVRFSKDKTPFKTHLHILWSPAEEAPFAPVYFFGTEPGDMTVGFGLTPMKGAKLTRFRAFVDTWGDQLAEAIAQTGMTFSDWGDPPLKRVPKPYEQDHPHADLLKLKKLILHHKMTDDWRSAEGGLLSAVRQRFETAEPVRRLLVEKLVG
ncbi:DUF2461 domain-containing protein [Marimonas sp. MJW-29]|uniref:DUF2461 domain-containing protein n=1 Tax=Sulfitobacter sediminis TaxID=3234186 RepID=A0ABV3RQ13_9RHOB